MGVLLALEKAVELGAREVELVLDSMLIVEQLSGRWKIKHPGIKPLAARAQALLAGFERWSIRHERRENNARPTRWRTSPSTIRGGRRGRTGRDDLRGEIGRSAAPTSARPRRSSTVMAASCSSSTRTATSIGRFPAG